MKLIRDIKKIIHFQSTLHQTITQCNIENNIKQQLQTLHWLAIHSDIQGVSEKKLCSEEVVVSLTTFGGRLYDAHIAIESIMQGSMKPNRIVLWISDEFETIELPLTLQNQMKRGLEIRYRKDMRSYTKLIYALKEFADSTIITIDDDIIYPYDLVENLVRMHKINPQTICSNVVLLPPKNLDNEYVPFTQWATVSTFGETHNLYVLEGFSGVLYPPHALNDEVFNEAVYMAECRTADDVWFSTMAMLNHTPIVYAQPHLNGFVFAENPNMQSVALKNVNRQGECLNDIQVKTIFRKYNIL